MRNSRSYTSGVIALHRSTFKVPGTQRPLSTSSHLDGSALSDHEWLKGVKSTSRLRTCSPWLTCMAGSMTVGTLKSSVGFAATSPLRLSRCASASSLGDGDTTVVGPRSSTSPMTSTSSRCHRISGSCETTMSSFDSYPSTSDRLRQSVTCARADSGTSSSQSENTRWGSHAATTRSQVT